MVLLRLILKISLPYCMQSLRVYYYRRSSKEQSNKVYIEGSFARLFKIRIWLHILCVHFVAWPLEEFEQTFPVYNLYKMVCSLTCFWLVQVFPETPTTPTVIPMLYISGLSLRKVFKLWICFYKTLLLMPQ